MRRVKKFRFIASFAILAVIQALPFVHFAMGNIKPDLLLSSVLFYALLFGQRVGCVGGIIAGALENAFSGSCILSHVFSFAIVGYIAGAYRNKLYIQRPFVQISLTFAAALSVFFFFYLFAQVFTVMPGFSECFFQRALPGAVYSATASPLVFYVLKRVYNLR